MNTSRINPVSAKLKRGSEHYLNGKPVYIERDAENGLVFITDSKERLPGDNYWWVNKSDLSVAPKYNTTLKVVKVKPAKQKEKDEYNEFFKSLYPKVPFNCQSCRRSLYAFTNTQKKASCAHLLPKAIFKSIATNPDNIVFLGVDVFGASCNCHSAYDSTVERRVKMPIYETVLKRYELLKPHLSAKDIQLAYEYLGITKKSGNLAKDLANGIEGVKA